MTTHSVSGVKSHPYIVSEAMKKKGRAGIASASAATAVVMDKLDSLTLSSRASKASITSQVVVVSSSGKYTKDAVRHELLELSKREEYAWILAHIYWLKDKKILAECDTFFQTALHILAAHPGKKEVFDSYKYEAIGKLVEMVQEYDEELISTPDGNGETPIAIACKCNNKEAVRAFAEKLKKRANLFIFDEMDGKESPLETACLKGYIEVVKDITTHVEDLTGIFEQRDRAIKLPLMHRIASGQIAVEEVIIDQLLTASKTRKINIFSDASHYNTVPLSVLDLACAKQNTLFLKVISNFFFTFTKYPGLDQLPMLLHIRKLKEAKNCEGLEHYIRAFFNSISQLGYSNILKAMLNAAYELKVEKAIRYVHRFASMNFKILCSMKTEEWTPLHEAGEYGDIHALKLYIKAANEQFCWTFSSSKYPRRLFYGKDNKGDTPFHRAAKNNHLEFAKTYLISQKHEFIDAILPTNNRLQTPLHYFARHNDCKGIDTCVERLAWASNPFLAKDIEGNTPFTIAIQCGNHLLVEKYLQWFKGKENKILPIDNQQGLQALWCYAVDQLLGELQAIISEVFESKYCITKDELRILEMAKKGEWKSVSEAMEKCAPDLKKIAFIQFMLTLAVEADNDEMVLQLLPYNSSEQILDKFQPLCLALHSGNGHLAKKYMDWMKRDTSAWKEARASGDIEKAMKSLEGQEELLFILDKNFHPLVLAVKKPQLLEKLLTIAKEKRVAIFKIEGFMERFCTEVRNDKAPAASIALLWKCIEMFKEEGKECFIKTGAYKEYLKSTIMAGDVISLRGLSDSGYDVCLIGDLRGLQYAVWVKDLSLFDFYISLPKVDMEVIFTIFRDKNTQFLERVIYSWKASPERFLLPDESGKSVLTIAVEKDDRELIKRLLSIVSTLKTPPAEAPLAPIMVALKFGLEEYFSDIDERVLLKVGAEGESPLQLAFEKKRVKFINDTLTKYPSLLLQTLPDGKTVLHHAASSSNSSIVEKCIAAAGERLELLAVQDKEGNTPLHLMPYSDLANSLIEKLRSAPSLLTIQNMKKESCLFSFCRRGMKSSILLMLSIVPNSLALIKEINSQLETGIQEAAKHFHHEIVRLYLERIATDVEFLAHQDAKGATLFHYLKSSELAIECINRCKERPDLFLKTNINNRNCVFYWNRKMDKAINIAKATFKDSPLLQL